MEREEAERVRLDASRADGPRVGETILQQSSRLPVTLLRGEQSRSDESRRPGLRWFRGRPLECRSQQFAALTEVAADEPECPKRGDEPKGRRRITLEQPLERDAEIFTLGREAP